METSTQTFNWSNQAQIEEIRKSLFHSLSEQEFSILLNVGKATGLNPFLREIYAVKYGISPANIFIGRDGYRKASQANPDYDYHLVDSVYANDDFSVINSEVHHKYSLKDRGALIGAYCITKRKSSTKPMFNFVELKEYTTGKSLWINKPSTMIKKVAEAQGLRMAFQALFSATYDETEQWEEQEKTLPTPAIQVNKIKPKTAETILKTWDKLWSIYCDKLKDEKTEDGELKYTQEKSDRTRTATIFNLYKKSSSTLLNEEEAKNFISRCEAKIEELTNK